MSTFQKYLLALAALAIFFIGGLTLAHDYAPSTQTPAQSFGITSSGNQDIYRQSTSTAINCPSATSTLVIAGVTTTADGNWQVRKFVQVSNDSANNIYLCRSTSCSASTGLRLNSSGGSYEQDFYIDGYAGPYSCISSSATSTLTETYSQYNQ